MTRQTGKPSYPTFTDTLYTSLCQVAEAALRGNRADSYILPAELVHECFLKLIRSKASTPTNRVEFRALAATMIRQVLVEQVRRKMSLKRGEDCSHVALDDELHAGKAELQFDVLVLDEALKRLADLDARQARTVELRFFGGLSIPEIAIALEVSTRTVSADWSLAKAWLRRELI